MTILKFNVMAFRDFFQKTPIKIPNKSGFDLSHENMLTLACGTLVPVMTDLLIPGDKVSLGSAFEVQLPPMATDFYGRVRLKMEAFFVPCRLLYGGWQKFMTSPTSSSQPGAPVVTNLPYVTVPAASASVLARGSLADYLGYKGSINTNQRINNILRFMAYHKIYDDWYRDSRIQQPLFSDEVGGSTLNVSHLPYWSLYNTQSSFITYGTNTNFLDGVSLFTLRQRNWSRDYFTNATPLPQAGTGASLLFSVSSSSPDESLGSFTIASLRAANALQQWLERNNIAGNRYADQIRAHFGVMPSDAVNQRAVYLGSSSSVIYNHSVYQTNNPSDTTSPGSARNPFYSVGSKFASPVGTDKNILVDSFEATEFGYFMVIGSLVPDAVYGTGVNRDFFRSKIGDFAFPLLQGVGDQPIYKAELANVGVDGNTMSDMATFGYTQRFSEYKFMEDEVHGELCDGRTLSAFALKRSFGGIPSVNLGSDFLQIPKSYLDGVAASDASTLSTFGAWADIFFQYRKVSVLSAYTIPTLGDPQNTHTEVLPNGGRRL